MEQTQLFADALGTLRRAGELRFATLYITYGDPAIHQDCLNLCMLDMPRTVEEQLARLFQAGRQFGQQHPQAELRTLALATEAWVNAQSRTGAFRPPADDPTRREVVWVEELTMLTPGGEPQVQASFAAIRRDAAGQITDLATPERSTQMRNPALPMVLRGIQNAALSDVECAALLMRRGGFYG